MQSKSHVGGIAGSFNGTFNQCYTNAEILSGSIAGTIKGYETNASDLSNCYYSYQRPYVYGGQFYEQGTYTAVSYASEFYTNSLFWSASVWSFSGTTYPTLAWEN